MSVRINLVYGNQSIKNNTLVIKTNTQKKGIAKYIF